MNRFVYLDNNATTKLNNNVISKIQPYLESQFGNPSSQYSFGKKIKNEIETARKNIAKLINCATDQIVFTSGGSEGNCSAINSAINQFPNKKKIITTKIEHSSILEYCKLLKNRGYKIIDLNVKKDGKIDFNQLKQEIDKETACVSVQFANNETGVITNFEELSNVIKEAKKSHDFIFHCDCVQGLGKAQINMNILKVDICSFSGHKIHAFKGAGFMYLQAPKKFIPLIAGHQERNLRGGTENVVGILSLGESAKYLVDNLEENTKNMLRTREYLETRLMELNNVRINCHEATRLPNTTSVTINSMNGNELMFMLEKQGICVSTGSACNSESSEPSHVLVAMGIENPDKTIRISIDETTTTSQIDYFIQSLKNICK